MIIIDSNSLIVLLLGLIEPSLINSHPRTSIYDEQDYYILISIIKDTSKLVVLPNIWTEVDNLLKTFRGSTKDLYVQVIIRTIKETSEKYIESHIVEKNCAFYDLGLTDTLILEYSKNCEMLITSDSKLSDYAIANGVNVFDLKKNKNESFK